MGVVYVSGALQEKLEPMLETLMISLLGVDYSINLESGRRVKEYVLANGMYGV